MHAPRSGALEFDTRDVGGVCGDGGEMNHYQYYYYLCYCCLLMKNCCYCCCY